MIDEDMTPTRRYEALFNRRGLGVDPFDDVYGYACQLERDLAAARRALAEAEAEIARLMRALSGTA